MDCRSIHFTLLGLDEDHSFTGNLYEQLVQPSCNTRVLLRMFHYLLVTYEIDPSGKHNIKTHALSASLGRLSIYFNLNRIFIIVVGMSFIVEMEKR